MRRANHRDLFSAESNDVFHLERLSIRKTDAETHPSEDRRRQEIGLHATPGDARPIGEQGSGFAVVRSTTAFFRLVNLCAPDVVTRESLLRWAYHRSGGTPTYGFIP